jgi:transcriptional regulator with XRE-family HTH domain
MNENHHPIDVHVGRRLRMLRKARGMSQEALAAEGQITFQQVQKYERGTNRLSASMLWTFAKALEVEPGYFFEGLERDRDAVPLPVVELSMTPEGYQFLDALARLAGPVVDAHRRLILAQAGHGRG